MRACVALLCLGFALACGREEGAPAHAAPRSLAPVDGEGRLDPAPYRGRIEAVESLLYSSETLDDDGWQALSKALLDLHNDIVFRDSSAGARDTSGRLFFLSARAEAAATVQHGERELEDLQGLWQRLSEEKFAPADWIRAGADAR